MLTFIVAFAIACLLAVPEASAETKKAPPVDCTTIDNGAKCIAAENSNYAVFERNYYCSLESQSLNKGLVLNVRCQAKQAVACTFGWEIAKDDSDPIRRTAEAEVPPGMYKIFKGKTFYACHEDQNNKNLITAEAIDMATGNEEKTKQERELQKTLTKMWE